MTAEQALQQLIEGNRRFASAKSAHPHQVPEWRKSLTEGQFPFAVVVGCSDSRVPVEIIFDQGLGDLFVVRVAGNILGESELGSILYAVLHTGAPLVFILGHECCGAVTAAFVSPEDREKEPKEIRRVLEQVDPAIKDIDPNLAESDRVHLGVEANVRRIVGLLKNNATMAAKIKENKVSVVGGIYALDTGVVRLICACTGWR